MRFPDSLLDDIRARLPVSSLVGRKVKLKRAGREWKGLSPFNAEKTPSFTVNDDKGFYHCFSSGKHGDIFSWLMEVEGLSFPEAVERLAEEAGVPLPARSSAEQPSREPLYEALGRAAAWFQDRLRADVGTRAREYLAGRGVSDEAVRAFGIGYAPDDRRGLRRHLETAGVAMATMVEAGLVVVGDDVPNPFDRFRDRIMFPIADLRGRVIAFGGRALGDVQPKYLNSPETPLFHKGSTLFNLDRARRAAHERGSLIAVEGYLDVVAMEASGFPQCTAPLGTALTPEQLTLLWRYSATPVLCFDGDRAGREAAFRVVDVALRQLLEPGKSLLFAILPDGYDPDELLKAEGPGAVAAAIGAVRPLVDVLWARELAAGPVETPEQRAGFEIRLEEACKLIPHRGVAFHYRAALRDRCRDLFGLGRRPAPPPPRREPETIAAAMARQREAAEARAKALAAGRRQRERQLAGVMLARPDLVLEHAEELVAMDMLDEEARAAWCLALEGPAAERQVLDLERGAALASDPRIRGGGTLSRLLGEHPGHEDVEMAFRQLLALQREAAAA